MTAIAQTTSSLDASDLWKAVLPTLEGRFSRPVFEMWIKPIRLITIEENVALLGVQHEFARRWVDEHFKAQIADALSGILDCAIDAHVHVAQGEQNGADRKDGHPVEPAASPAPTSERTTLNERYGFEDFVIGTSNSFAHSAAMAVASAPARAYNPLFIYGGVGLGKTHLLHAIGNRLRRESPQTRVLYVSCEKFTNEWISAVRDNRTPGFRDRYRDVDVLLIDDIQFLAGKETTQEEFVHTFNALHESGRQIILSSDRPPSEIQTLESRLRSRFEWGLMADIQRPDLETREAILRKKAQIERIPVPDEVNAYIARLVSSNVRELEGALTRVVAYAGLMRRPINLDVAADVLKTTIVNAALKRTSISKIKETVSSAHGITVREMDAGRRDQRLAGPRQIAMYVATQLTDYSLPYIAREFGKKDHTTVMYARDKIREQMQRDEVYRNKIRQLIAICQAA